jgi:uroporphyrin-III C-methyltransferase
MITFASPNLRGVFAALRLWLDDLVFMRPRQSGGAKTPTRGHVTLLGAGPGAADLITLRGLNVLQAADLIFYDRLVDPALLRSAKAGAVCVSVGKAPGNHSMPQAQISAKLVEAAERGLQVVRLKCGDPGIFGRGAEEAEALEAAGQSWSIIPGVTAACAAAASAKSFLTERGQTERVVFSTGHRREGQITDWSACAAPGTTLACYMGVSTAADLQSGLLAAGWPPTCEVEIVSKAQTSEQKLLRGRLSGLAAQCASHKSLNPAMLFVRWPAASASALQLFADTADCQSIGLVNNRNGTSSSRRSALL